MVEMQLGFLVLIFFFFSIYCMNILSTDLHLVYFYIGFNVPSAVITDNSYVNLNQDTHFFLIGSKSDQISRRHL